LVLLVVKDEEGFIYDIGNIGLLYFSYAITRDIFLARRRYGSFFSLDRKETKDQGCVSSLGLSYQNFFVNKQQTQ
jgi:hypothetical protein